MNASLLFWTFIFLAPLPLFSQPTNRNDAALFRYVFDIPGGYVNDHCLLQGADSLWHLYFIEGTVSNEVWYRDSNQIIIGHATSPDLLTHVTQNHVGTWGNGVRVSGFLSPR